MIHFPPSDNELIILHITSLLVIETLRFGPKAWIGTSPIVAEYFTQIFCIGTLLALSAQWTFANQFSRCNASFWSAYVCQNVSSKNLSYRCYRINAQGLLGCTHPNANADAFLGFTLDTRVWWTCRWSLDAHMVSTISTILRISSESYAHLWCQVVQVYRKLRRQSALSLQSKGLAWKIRLPGWTVRNVDFMDALHRRPTVPLCVQAHRAFCAWYCLEVIQYLHRCWREFVTVLHPQLPHMIGHYLYLKLLNHDIHCLYTRMSPHNTFSCAHVGETALSC